MFIYFEDKDLEGEPADAGFSSRSSPGQVISAQTYMHCNYGCNCSVSCTALVSI